MIGKVVQVILALQENRNFVIAELEGGVLLDFPVPTIQEVRDKFLFGRAKTQPDKPAQPPNKFFIFRANFHAEIYNFKFQVPAVSALASKAWQKCRPEVMEIFTNIADLTKIEHG